MSIKKTSLLYGAVALLLGSYWVLAYMLEDISSPVYLMFSLRNFLSVLPLLSGMLLGLSMKVTTARGWAVLDGIVALLLLPAAFRFLTISLIGVGRWSWLALHTPGGVSGICALVCGLLLGHMVQVLRQAR